MSDRRTLRKVLALAALGLFAVLGFLLLRSVQRPARTRMTLPGEDARAQVSPELSPALPVLAAQDDLGGREPPARARREGRARQLVATVLDPGRRPIAGVRVRAFVAEEPVGEAHTDARGRVELALPHGESAMLLLAEREGFLHARKTCDAERSALLVLRPAAMLAGRVLDAQTKVPISDAVVESAHLACSECPPARALTDTHGRFELEVASGSGTDMLRFTLRARGFVATKASFVAREPGATLEHDFVMVRRRSEVHGRVVDLVTGAALPDAHLVLGLDVLGVEADGSFSSTTTVRLDVPPAPEGAPERLVVRAPGHCRVILPAPGPEAVLVPLPPVASLVGRVSDGEGRALAAELWLAQPEKSPRIGTPLARLHPDWKVWDSTTPGSTDRNGRYRIEGMLPWVAGYRLSVVAPGHEPRELEVAEPARPEEELVLDVTLESQGSATIHGTVLLNGNPASGTVTWQQDAGHHGRAEIEQGRYRLVDLPAGEIRLTAAPGGRAIADFVPAAKTVVRLGPGQELQHDFALELAIGAISGRVSHADGAPAVRLELRARMEGTHWNDAQRTDEHGNYRLLVPDCGFTYELSIADGGVRQSRAGIAPGASVDLVLPEMGALLLRAIESGSERSVRPNWSWRSAGRGDFEPLFPSGADAQGLVSARLPVGRVDLHADGSQAGFKSETRLDLAVVREGEPERVTFELEPGLTLELQLVPAERPPSDAVLVLAPEGLWADLDGMRNIRGNIKLSLLGRQPGLSLTPLSFDREGRTRLRGLTPGRHRIEAFHERLSFDPEVIEVLEPAPGGEPQLVRVRWTSGAR